jgi:adenylate cyclase
MFDQVIWLLSRAIELDSDYAEPYAGMAMAHNLDFQNHWTDATDALDVAAHFAKLAVEKGPSVPYAHFMAGVMALWNRDLKKAKGESEAALAINPNYALAYGTYTRLQRQPSAREFDSRRRPTCRVAS